MDRHHITRRRAVKLFTARRLGVPVRMLAWIDSQLCWLNGTPISGVKKIRKPKKTQLFEVTLGGWNPPLRRS